MSKALNNDDLSARLEKITESYASRKDTSAVQFALESPSRDWRWEWSEVGASKQYFIASTTKLYVVSLIMQLRYEGVLEIDAPAARYLPDSVLCGIHVYKDKDYSSNITVRELLAQTSGIADYFEQAQSDGSTQIKKFLQQDFAWSLDDVLDIAKHKMKPRFPPSTPGKAFYSDTNYQLLGAIIEHVTGENYETVLKNKILLPLGLKDTFAFTLETTDRYDSLCPMLYGKHEVKIPKAMASVRADGGIVSTTHDGLVFLKAFMEGKLFPEEYVQEIQEQWNPIFAPFDYGMGIMRFRLPAIYRLFAKIPDMVGHSGASGAVLYYIPKLDLYISGTVNQIKKHSLPYQAMVQMVMAFMKALK